MQNSYHIEVYFIQKGQEEEEEEEMEDEEDSAEELEDETDDYESPSPDAESVEGEVKHCQHLLVRSTNIQYLVVVCILGRDDGFKFYVSYFSLLLHGKLGILGTQ